MLRGTHKFKHTHIMQVRVTILVKNKLVQAYNINKKFLSRPPETLALNPGLTNQIPWKYKA